MKFCMILEFFVPHYNGGGERRYYELTKRLVQEGHQVDVLTMKVKGAPEDEIIGGINVHRIGPVIQNPPFRTKLDFIKYMKATVKWLRKNKYTIIDAQAYSPLLCGSLVSKFKSTPIIATVHDTSSGNKDQWIQDSNIASMAEKILLKLPYNKILTVSNSTKNSLVNDFNVSDEKIEIISNGVDLELIDSINCDKKDNNRILFVGRLVPHKHADHLLEVINSLKDKIDDIHLVIVGKGVEKENLEEYIKNNNLENYVEFMQDLTNEELIYQMKLANILVLPSTREGFGMVLSEANACYTPTIAYKSGGVVDVVVDGKTGYLVEPENKEELLEKVEYVLENKDIEEKLSIQGRKHVEENFNWNNIVYDYINFASKLVNCKKIHKSRN